MTTTTIKPTKKAEMNTLLDNLVTHSKHSESLDKTISRLNDEKVKAQQSRDVLEIRYIQDTLVGIASRFEDDAVPFKSINSYMLSCMKLNKDNWAFKASNGSPVGVSTIKNWKKCVDEELKVKYEAVSKGSLFQKLNRFEGIKGRKFTQGDDGYAVLKRIKDEEGKVVENPAVEKRPTTTTTDDKQKGDKAGFTKPSGLLKSIASLLDDIEKSSFTLKDDKILLHLARAQELLIKETKVKPKTKTTNIDDDI